MGEANLFRFSEQNFELISIFELLSMAPLTQELVYLESIEQIIQCSGSGVGASCVDGSLSQVGLIMATETRFLLQVGTSLASPYSLPLLVAGL